MTKNRYGFETTNQQGNVTYEYVVTELLKKLNNKEQITNDYLVQVLEAIGQTGGTMFQISTTEVSTSGTIPVNYGGSVYNTGSANATFNGVTLRPGMSISWNDGEFGTISYDATGTSLLICYKYK